MGRLRGAPVAFVPLLLFFIACGSNGATESTATRESTTPTTTVARPVVTTIVGDLEVVVERERLYEARRSVAVDFISHADAVIELSEVQLVSGLYEVVAPEDRNFGTRSRGVPISIPVAYGDPVCTDDVDDVVRVRYRRDGKPTETVVGTVSDRIRRVHDAECATRDAERRVSLTFGDDWSYDGDDRASGSVVVDAIGDTEVEVVEVNGSIVLTAIVEPELPTTGDLRLEAIASRCDTHALIESKKTYTFSVRVRLDGEEPIVLALDALDTPVKAIIDAAIEGCVAAG